MAASPSATNEPMSRSTTLHWTRNGLPDGGGYRVYWRETTAPQWQFDRWVGDTNTAVLENIVIDNYLFGVAAVGPMGNESIVVFPSAQP